VSRVRLIAAGLAAVATLAGCEVRTPPATATPTAPTPTTVAVAAATPTPAATSPTATALAVPTATADRGTTTAAPPATVARPAASPGPPITVEDVRAAADRAALAAAEAIDVRLYREGVVRLDEARATAIALAAVGGVGQATVTVEPAALRVTVVVRAGGGGAPLLEERATAILTFSDPATPAATPPGQAPPASPPARGVPSPRPTAVDR
jgi:hypothetical protein